MIPSISSTKQLTSNTISITFNSTNQQVLKSYIERYRLFHTLNNNQYIEWPAQLINTIGTLNDSCLIDNSSQSNSFNCFNYCLSNYKCKAVSYKANKNECKLYSSSILINTQNTGLEIKILNEFSNEIKLENIPHNQKYKFKIMLYENSSNYWSELSNESKELDLTIRLNVSYKRLGFKRIEINMQQLGDTSQSLSRYNLIKNDQTISSINYQWSLVPFNSFEPKYIEYPLQNEIKNTNIDECLNKCIDRLDCIQYIWINSTEFYPNVSLNSCYLQTQLNIHKAKSFNLNFAYVGFLKNNATKLMYETNELDYKLFVEFIDPYGFKGKSNEMTIKLKTLKPSLNLSLKPFELSAGIIINLDETIDQKETILVQGN